MRLTGQRMIKVADKSEISHSLSDASKLLKSSAANSKYTVFNARGSSTSTSTGSTHELKKKLKKRKNSFESGAEDVKFSKLSELEDMGSTRISPKGNNSK